MNYRNSSGTHFDCDVVLGAQDANANAIEFRGSTGGAVTGGPVVGAAVGDSTNISIRLIPKGTGKLILTTGIDSSGNSTITGGLSVSGGSTFGGRVVGSSGLQITGATTLGTLQAGASTVTSLSVAGGSTFSGPIIGSSGLVITGATTLGTLSAGASTVTGFSAGNSTVTTITVGTGVQLKGFYSTTFAWIYPSFSSGQVTEITLSTAVGDVSPGDLVMVSLGLMNTDAVEGGFRQSTAAASRVTIIVTCPGSTAASSGSGTGYIAWADLT